MPEHPLPPRALEPYPYSGDVEDALTQWDANKNLSAFWSADDDASARAWCRWTVLAEPGPVHELAGSVEGVLSNLDRLLKPAWEAGSGHSREGARPGPGWGLVLSYDLGLAIEPRSQGRGGSAGCVPSGERAGAEVGRMAAGIPHTPADGRGPVGAPPPHSHAQPDRAIWPAATLWRIDDGYVYDHHLRHWFRFGQPSVVLKDRPGQNEPRAQGWQLGALQSDQGEAHFAARVEDIRAAIAAGDVYQVNLAHRLRAEFEGSARALWHRLVTTARPRYGAYLEWPDEAGRRRVIASVSPELFLERQGAEGRVRSRPMKGTSPMGAGAPAGGTLTSPKDLAELTMIVDLMRNDLGRWAKPGSVRVDGARSVEPFGRAGSGADRAASAPGAPAGGTGLWQASATIGADLCAGTPLSALLRATFPPGSVTGAPKISAMSLIDRFEPSPRGPYCGCAGFLSDSGHLALSVTIRTALIHGPALAGARDAFAPGSVLDWSVGAGIVADSDPRAEWLETMAKAGPIVACVGAHGPAAGRGHAGSLTADSTSTRSPSPPAGSSASWPAGRVDQTSPAGLTGPASPAGPASMDGPHPHEPTR